MACLHIAEENSRCRTTTWPIMIMTRSRLIFPCKTISAQGHALDPLKYIHVVLVISCMLCGNTLLCFRQTSKHIASVHVLHFLPRSTKLHLGFCLNISCSSPHPCIIDDLSLWLAKATPGLLITVHQTFCCLL